MNQRNQKNVRPARNRVVALFRSTNTPPANITDAEFGEIVIKRSATAKYVRLRMQTDGQLAVTLPRFASERHARSLVDDSRPAIRSWRLKHVKNTKPRLDGERVGQSHVLNLYRQRLQKQQCDYMS